LPEGSGLVSVSPDAFGAGTVSPEGSGLVSDSPDAYGTGSVSLEGYTQRVRSRAPSGKMTLTKSKNTLQAVLSESSRGSGATVGDSIPGYPKRQNQ